jgi:hypothetical protein
LPVTQVFCEAGPDLYHGRYGSAPVLAGKQDVIIFTDGHLVVL